MLNDLISCIEASVAALPVSAADRQRAVAVLSQLLASPDAEHDAIAYRPFSRLTPSGFPVEFSFGNPAGELRYTTEVGGHKSPPAARLRLVSQRLGRLGVHWDDEVLDWCAELQRTNSLLHYGAWVSIRHHNGAERYKMYVEVPRSSHAAAMRWFPVTADVAQEITGRGIRLIMLGLPPQSDETEFYFGINGMRYNELPLIFDWFDAVDSAAAVLETIEAICGRFLNRSTRNRQNGLSVKRSGDGPWRVTLFSQADDLFGSGSHTRLALLRAANILGCDLTSYAAFSSSAADEFDDNRHCMLALTPLPDHTIDLRVGLSPPPPRLEAIT